MRISADAKPLIKQLKQFSEDNKRKLTQMVINAAMDLATVASDNTPVAPEDWEIRPWYVKMYAMRKNLGIDESPGYHTGAWEFSPDSSFAFNPDIRPSEGVADYVKQEMYQGYTLGQPFYVGAIGPAFANLEKGYSPRAPEGIMKPTVDQIIDIYKMNLVQYYQRA